MPYVITTYPPHPVTGEPTEGRRTAVATLDEAREQCADIIDADGDDIRRDHFHYATNHLPGSGGTIGPLPDGTIIEVKRVDAYELLLRIPGMDVPKRPEEVRARTERPENVAAIVARFNEAQR